MLWPLHSFQSLKQISANSQVPSGSQNLTAPWDRSSYNCDWIKWAGGELAWVNTFICCYLKLFVVAECCSVIFHEKRLHFAIKLYVNLHVKLGVVPCTSLQLWESQHTSGSNLQAPNMISQWRAAWGNSAAGTGIIMSINYSVQTILCS